MNQREIKFRVWDGKKMFYPELLHTIKSMDEGKTWVFTDGYIDSNDYEEGELQQYTNLKDKNGKEIYEGDVVKPLCHPEHEKDIAEVRWFWGCWYYFTNNDKKGRLQDLCSAFNDNWKVGSRCEVIGNIYENPNLIK